MSEKKGKPLSSQLKIFYGVGDCAFNLMTAVESYYFNFFLTDLAKFDLGLVTTITTVASMVDAFLSWVYGAILNSIKPKKWGRYRSWLILTTWLVPFLYAFQFIKIGDGVPAAILIILAAILSHFVWNFAYVANVSMIAVAGRTPEDRSQLAATRAAWNNLANVLFSYVCLPVAAFCGGIIGETNKFGGAAFVFGVIMFVMYFAHFKMFEGYEDVSAETGNKKDVTRTSVSDMLRALGQNPHLISLIIIDLAKWMFNFVCMGSAVYYFTYVAGNAGMLPRYILISNIVCIIGAYGSKYICNAISTRTTATITFFAMAIFCALAFMNYTNPTLVLIFMSLGRLGYGICYACTPALYADTIIYSEWKTGKNASGWISGLQNVPLKVGVLTRGIIINACLAAGGFVAGIAAEEVTDGLKKAICMAFIGVPAIALVIAGVLMIVGYRLSKDKVLKYQSEIAARRA